DRPKWWLAPQSDVRFADVSPDGRWIATGSHIAEEVPIKIWDARTGKHIADLPAYTGGIVRFSPDGRWLATMGLQFRLWKTSDWSEGTRISGIYGTFTRDGALVAVGDGFGIVRLVDPESGREPARLEAPEQTHMYPEGFTADGAQLVMWGVQS